MSRRVLRLRSAALMRFSAIRADFPGPPRKRKSGFFQSRRHDHPGSAARPQGQSAVISFWLRLNYQARVRAFPQG